MTRSVCAINSLSQAKLFSVCSSWICVEEWSKIPFFLNVIVTWGCVVSFMPWLHYSRGKRLDWFQCVSFGGQEIYFAPFGTRTTMSGSRSPQPGHYTHWATPPNKAAAACANFCINARIANARRTNWLAYFLLLFRRRRVTIVLLCSPCRIVSNVTCEPFIMSDTIFTSNISSKVVWAFTVSNLPVYITVQTARLCHLVSYFKFQTWYIVRLTG